MLELFQSLILIIVGLFVWYLGKGLDSKKKSKKSSN